MRRWLVVAALVFTAAVGGQSSAPSAECRPGAAPVDLRGAIAPADEHTYLELPVGVASGTSRIEVGYEWASNGEESAADETVVDLGLWDQRGTSGPAGFRGWSGSRQGKIAAGQAPIFVQADVAERGYVPGPIVPGTWSVELGFGAVHSAGGTWHVTVRRLDVPTGPTWTPDPVDPSYVAKGPGWYRADLHLHAHESNPSGPDPARMIEFARRAKLDVVPVTEYVTDVHWGTLGAAQRANPDLIIWPGREVITYFGHSIVLGETPSTLEYRHGYDGVELPDIQHAAVGDGALFGVAHPTIFPGGLRSLCRGCEFQLGDQIDWDLVDTMEVVSSPAIYDPATFDLPEPGRPVAENPFTATAIDLWESLLQQGHRITGVGGSDDKSGEHYGMTATMIGSEQLSRPALAAALQGGHAYVQARGADDSPTLELDVHTPDGQRGTFGDTLVGQSATIDLTVSGANGQTVIVSRNGTEVQRIPVTADEFTTSIAADRAAPEGPLGTFWRVDVRDESSLTAVGNPVFLADRQPPPKERVTTPASAPAIPNFPATATTPTIENDSSSASNVGWWVGAAVAIGAAVVVVAVAVRNRRPREHPDSVPPWRSRG